jgi:pilus assembly protein Flp/PilA
MRQLMAHCRVACTSVKEVVMAPLVVLRTFVRDESGQDLLEYGMLAALIALVVMGAVTTSGLSISGLWTGISTSLAVLA